MATDENGWPRMHGFDMQTTFLLFGDSIVHGSWDPEGGGWGQRLRRQLEERSSDDHLFVVYNLGICGDTSAQLLARFSSEAQCRLRRADRTIVLFGIGVNDAKFNTETGAHRVTIEAYRQNVSTLIEQARRITPMVACTSILPIDETVTRPLSWNHAEELRSVDVDAYDAALQDVCTKSEAPYLALRDLPWPPEAFDDGLHPNSASHERIVGRVIQHLGKLRWLS
jgi:lysophospholipase L1-like esterase